MTEAIVVRVTIEQSRSGLLVARSDDLPGLLLTSRSLDDIIKGAPGVIKNMIEHMFSGEVQVVSAKMGNSPAEETSPAWVALPAHIASAAQAHC